MYKEHTVIHPRFQSYAAFIHAIPLYFQDIGSVLREGRNEVRMVQIAGDRFVIKYFKRITFANRLIYARFRKSKAQRSYENALLLQSRGILTPQPVAFINNYRGMQLKEAYFVSLFVDFTSLNDAIKSPLFNDKKLIIQFARFVFRIHSQGIFHRDLHLDNVMVKGSEGLYQFCLIDINRMHFTVPRKSVIANNLTRINLPVQYYAILADEYARLSGIDPFYLMRAILQYRQAGHLLKSYKNRIKQFFRL